MMKRVLIGALSACLIVLPGRVAALSDEDLRKEFAACAAKERPVRLSCYDAIAYELGFKDRGAGKLDAKREAARQQLLKKLGRGSWNVTVERSKVDDSENVTLVQRSNEPYRDRFGRGELFKLVLSCKENTTRLWIVMGGAFVTDTAGHGIVTMRIDKRNAQKIHMKEATDHSALGLWSGGKSIPLIKQLVGAKSLFLMAIPYNAPVAETTFSLAGLDEAIKPLRKSCGW